MATEAMTGTTRYLTFKRDQEVFAGEEEPR